MTLLETCADILSKQFRVEYGDLLLCRQGGVEHLLYDRGQEKALADAIPRYVGYKFTLSDAELRTTGNFVVKYTATPVQLFRLKFAPGE